MSNLLLEFRQALRSLLRAPSFTLPIVIVLGLGLGANVALHAILQTVLFRPLPVPQRERLMLVKTLPKGEKGTWPSSHPQFEDLKAFPGPFAGMAEASMVSQVSLRVGEGRVPVTIPMVGEGWFRVIGLQPHLGRTFTTEEEASGAPVAVLSHRLWKTAFQGDPAILGRTLVTEQSRVPITVVGVGPAGFEGLELGRREDLWMPMKAMSSIGAPLRPNFFTHRGMLAFSIVARLKPGATRREAQAALDAAGAAMALAHPDTDSGRRFVLESLEASEQKLLERVLPQRSLLLTASSLAMLLAIVGTSGLFAARALKREQEMATRCALGADRGSLARPLLLEALLLALMAAPVALGAGLLLARRFMLKPGQSAAEAIILPSLDGRILALGLGLSLGALLLAALIPLLKARLLDPARVLASRGASSGTPGGGIFVIGQVALSLALLVASSMALGAFRRAARMGYPTAHRAFMTVNTAEDPELPERLLARLRAMPEVASAARGIAAPLDNFRFMFGMKGGERTEMENFPGALVGGDWFRTLGVPVLEGRDFTDRDGRDRVILNESLARRFFPAGHAVGRFLNMGPEDRLEVIGVVADHRMRPDPDFHLPMLWLSHQWLTMNEVCLVAEGRGSARSLAARLKEALAQEKPGAAPTKLITMEDHVAATLHQEHQNLRLLGSLGMGSLMLACFGLWAALNLQVALKGRELAIRMALGATARQLATRILGLGASLLTLGLAAGAFVIWLLIRLAASRWAGLPALSGIDLLAASGALIAAGLLACLIPALRAARTQPADTLRSE